jgi:polyferredoxin
MKATTRNALIMWVGLVVGFVGLLRSVLGLPEWTWILYAAFPIAFWTAFLLQRRETRRGQLVVTPTTSEGERRYTWILLGSYFVGCASSPFILAYAGSNLSFSTLAILSAITFLVLAFLTIFIRGRRTKT